MYGSRNAPSSRARQPKARLGLTGVALTGAEGRSSSARPERAIMPVPAPPSPTMDFSADHQDNRCDPAEEYARKQREETKAQLQSITGRMFQVCHCMA